MALGTWVTVVTVRNTELLLLLSIHQDEFLYDVVALIKWLLCWQYCWTFGGINPFPRKVTSYGCVMRGDTWTSGVCYPSYVLRIRVCCMGRYGYDALPMWVNVDCATCSYSNSCWGYTLRTVSWFINCVKVRKKSEGMECLFCWAECEDVFTYSLAHWTLLSQDEHVLIHKREICILGMYLEKLCLTWSSFHVLSGCLSLLFCFV